MRCSRRTSRGSTRPEAARLADFLTGETARQIFHALRVYSAGLGFPDCNKSHYAAVRPLSASLELPHAVPLYRILRNAGTP
jgi:hypothetical protein